MTNITQPPWARRTLNPMLEIGETRVYGTRFLQSADGIAHIGEIVREIEVLTNSMFGTDIRVIYIGDVSLLRQLKVGEWTGLVFQLEHLEEHKIGNLLTISFLARRISDNKEVFTGSYRIRLLK